MASGTVRMSEKMIAASSAKRSSGCSVTSHASSGVCASARKLPARLRVALYSGQVAPGLAHHPDRRVGRGLAQQRPEQRVVLHGVDFLTPRRRAVAR